MTTWEERKEREKINYLNDVVVCKRLLDTLEEDFENPFQVINSAKTTRIRLLIHDILKKW